MAVLVRAKLKEGWCDMAFLESMITKKVTKPYAEKVAKKARNKLDETKEDLETKAEGMALKSGLIGKKYSREYEDEMKRETRGMKSGGVAKYAKGGKIDGCARKGKTKGRMV